MRDVTGITDEELTAAIKRGEADAAEPERARPTARPVSEIHESAAGPVVVTGRIGRAVERWRRGDPERRRWDR